MSMRKLLLAACLALLAPAVHADPKTTVVIGIPIEPPGLDPTIAAPVAIGEVTLVNIYEGLTRLSEDGKIVPLLAKSWEVTPDGLTYTFHLQDGVKFHDGTPLDSSVVKFTFDRARGEASTNPQKQFFTPITDIQTPDPLTAVFKLEHPVSNFTYYLAWPSAVVVAPATADGNKTAPNGTGPFKFEQWVQGDSVVLVRNDGYWNKDHLAKLDRATFRFISDPQAQVSALKAGDVDAVPNLAAGELFQPFETDQRFEAVAGTSDLKVVAGMNNAREPFKDIRVRQALQYALDRQAIMEAVSGYGQPIGSHYSPSDPGYVDTTGVLPYDPDKAKALLAEAGYPDGLSFTIKVPQMDYAGKVSELMASYFSEIGVAMEIIPTEFPAKWIDEVYSRKDYDMTIIAHAEPLDISIYAKPDYYFNYKNPELDKVIDEADSTTDEAQHWALYGKAQEILAHDVPALYIYVLPKLGVWNKDLKGLWHNTSISMTDLSGVYWAQ